MREILAELDVRDDEHPDTWLISDSGWTLTADQDGRVVLENDESEGPARHMRGVTRERVLDLWRRLAAGMLEEIEREPWQPGYGTLPMTPEQRAELEAAVLTSQRQFFDSLGPERREPRCRKPKCTRGAVQASVFCRVHQFENVTGKPCPFSH
jgi:hypothetical protein